MDTNHNHIVSVDEWKRVTEIPYKYSNEVEDMDEEVGNSGVYQLAYEPDIQKIGESIVHPEILYTGKSKNIHVRTYGIRQPNGSHGASRYMREHKLDRSKYFVRILYTNVDPKDLESEIHRESEKRFGNRFKWKEASAGNDGNLSKVYDLLTKMSSDDLLSIKSTLKDIYLARVKQESLQQWEDES